MNKTKIIQTVILSTVSFLEFSKIEYLMLLIQAIQNYAN